MKIYKFPQHQIASDQLAEIKNAVKVWQAISQFERDAFIDSINVHTNPDWEKMRTGKITASAAHQFLSNAKAGTGLGDSAKKLCYKVMAEKMGWRESKSPFSEHSAIRRGLVFEPAARELASQALNTPIAECGFVTSDDELFGCSPDGLIVGGARIKAIVEIKTPSPPSFYEQLMNHAKPEYQSQMQFQMNVCKCERAYFVLFCPEVSDKVFIIEYERDEDQQIKIESRKQQVKEYMQKIQETVGTYTEIRG